MFLPPSTQGSFYKNNINPVTTSSPSSSSSFGASSNYFALLLLCGPFFFLGADILSNRQGSHYACILARHKTYHSSPKDKHQKNKSLVLDLITESHRAMNIKKCINNLPLIGLLMGEPSKKKTAISDQLIPNLKKPAEWPLKTFFGFVRN